MQKEAKVMTSAAEKGETNETSTIEPPPQNTKHANHSAIQHSDNRRPTVNRVKGNREPTSQKH